MSDLMKSQEPTITVQTIECWYSNEYFMRTEEQMTRILVDGVEESLIDETGYDVSDLELEGFDVVDEYDVISPNKERTEEIIHKIYLNV